MIRIVRATELDFETVLALVDQLYRELSEGADNPESLDRDRVIPQLRAAGDQFAAFLALDGGDGALGVVTLAEAFAIYAGGRYGIIQELYVHPSHRSRGVGALLLDSVIAEARRRGWIRVDVAAQHEARWHRAVAFYQRNGFVDTGRKLKYLLAP